MISAPSFGNSLVSPAKNLASGHNLEQRLRRALLPFRQVLLSSEPSFILLAALVGLAAGTAVVVIHGLAVSIQIYLFGFSPEAKLSPERMVSPWYLLIALPVGGAIIGFTRTIFAKRLKSAVDVMEANALYGGRIPFRDSIVLIFQNIISNGFGASVGLEAAYAQAGGGIASRAGQVLDLKRQNLRTLVGAGAGAAIAAAFGAPLAGAFYAFEIVLGGYTAATLAPVAAACLMGVLAAQTLNFDPFVVASSANHSIRLLDYGLFMGLGIVAALVGILLIRSLSFVESMASKLPVHEGLRPVIGGILLMPLCIITPQVMSSGHGSLYLYLSYQLGLSMLMGIFCLKALASIISLSFGFRGGLFFASLFLGAILGAIYATAINSIYPMALLSINNTALVGMAALAVAVIGGPMTMSLLVLEITHDFALTAGVFTATLFTNAVVRDRFGHNLATFRLKQRGENIFNARDIGWTKSLSAIALMRKTQDRIDYKATVGQFKAQYPLSVTSRVFLVDEVGVYRGLILTAKAYIDQVPDEKPILDLMQNSDIYVARDDSLASVLKAFKRTGADEIAVVDAERTLLGYISERLLNRRYAEELERNQKEFFGEE